MGKRKERALTEKDILRFEAIIDYLERHSYVVSKDELSKLIGVSQGSFGAVLNKLTYYERRLYEDDNGKIGLNNDLDGCLIDSLCPTRECSFTTEIDRKIAVKP